MKELKERLREERIAHHYTQASLASRIHVTRQAVSKWENGHAVPDIDMLRKLCGLYNLSIEKLIGNAPDERTDQSEKPAEEASGESAEEDKSQNWMKKGELFLILTLFSFVSCLIPVIGLAVPFGIFFYMKKPRYLLLCILCTAVRIFLILPYLS